MERVSVYPSKITDKHGNFMSTIAAIQMGGGDEGCHLINLLKNEQGPDHRKTRTITCGAVNIRLTRFL